MFLPGHACPVTEATAQSLICINAHARKRPAASPLAPDRAYEAQCNELICGESRGPRRPPACWRRLSSSRTASSWRSVRQGVLDGRRSITR
jgi:hypothetical protein